MNALFLIGMPGMGEWAIIGLFVLIFFGAKKMETVKLITPELTEIKFHFNELQMTGLNRIKELNSHVKLASLLSKTIEFFLNRMDPLRKRRHSSQGQSAADPATN